MRSQSCCSNGSPPIPSEREIQTLELPQLAQDLTNGTFAAMPRFILCTELMLTTTTYRSPRLTDSVRSWHQLGSCRAEILVRHDGSGRQ